MKVEDVRYNLTMSENLKIDRKVISVVDGFKNKDARIYWHTASSVKRMRFFEIMSQTNYGYDPVTDRL